jgi:hypothetical protein
MVCVRREIVKLADNETTIDGKLEIAKTRRTIATGTQTQNPNALSS